MPSTQAQECQSEVDNTCIFILWLNVRLNNLLNESAALLIKRAEIKDETTCTLIFNLIFNRNVSKWKHTHLCGSKGQHFNDNAIYLNVLHLNINKSLACLFWDSGKTSASGRLTTNKWDLYWGDCQLLLAYSLQQK